MIENDPEADAAYVKLLGRVDVVKTVALAGMQADLDVEGRVVGIEINELLQKKSCAE